MARERVRVESVRAPRIFLLTLALVLVIWLAYLLSAALLAVGNQFPGLAVETANAATSLACGTPSCGSTSPADFEYTAPTNSWAVIGVRSTTGAGNPDVCVYQDAALTQSLACSNLSGNTTVDFVAVDYHHTTGGNLDYIRTTRASGSGDMCTNVDCGTSVLVANGSSLTTTWTSSQIVRVFNLVAGPGTYRVGVVVTSGTANLGMAVFNSAGQANYAAGRSGAIAEADVHGVGSGQNEGLYVTFPESDTLALVVWSNTVGGTANYRVEFRTAEKLVANSPSDEPGIPAADFLYIPTEPRGWSVIALRPGTGNPAPDADLKVYTRPDYVTQLERSSAEPGIVDFIVANYANAPEDTATVLMISLGPLGGYKLEWTYDPPVLASGEPTAVSLTGHVGKAWKMNLTAGVQYRWTFVPTPGSKGDAAFGLYGPRTIEPVFTYGTRADSLAGSDIWGESGTGWSGDLGVEMFQYTPQLSGEFLLYAYQKRTFAVGGSLIWFPTSLLDVPVPGTGRAVFAAPRPSPSHAGEGVSFSFEVPSAGAVRLVIVDASGRVVRTLIDGNVTGGPMSTSWDGRLASGAPARAGLYFARLERPGMRPEARRFVRLD